MTKNIHVNDRKSSPCDAASTKNFETIPQCN